MQVRERVRLALVAVTLTIAGCAPAAAPAETGPRAGTTVSRAVYGRMPDGREVELYTLANANGVEVRAINYGGIITSVFAPDRNGQRDDIVLGFDSLPQYLSNSPYFGAVVGRYANRIAGAQFTLDGVRHQLSLSHRPNHQHGGARGFDKVLWRAERVESDSGAGVLLTHTSPDGDEGYPGTLQTRVRYLLTPRNELIIDYEATTDKPTIVNLTQHTYWNLRGAGRGDILGHQLTINADSITPVDSTRIPTGAMMHVAGTPFDFRSPAPIGARIDRTDDAQIRFGRGYDHNFVINRRGAGLVHAARVTEPVTGRSLDVHTTEPGMQLYSGNFLNARSPGKAGLRYPPRTGLALETEHYPDSPNKPHFPSTTLRPGEVYRSRTVFTVGVVR